MLQEIIIKTYCNETKPKLLATVVELTALYALPVWKKALDSAKNLLKLDQVQRRMAL